MPYSNHPLAPELPFLRRYARAATGLRNVGDDIIASAMPALAHATTDTNSPYPRRIRQFRVLVPAIDAVLTAENSATQGVGKNVASLPPALRHALLLTTLEDFQPNEAAAILDTSSDELQQLVLAAQEALQRLSSKKILIIEDDDLMAAAIADVVTKLGHTVSAHARSEQEALDAVAAMPPALILADIHLGTGGSGLLAVQKILSSSTIPVIFITGHPELLLTGQGTEPTFVIRKPYRVEALQTAIGQALST